MLLELLLLKLLLLLLEGREELLLLELELKAAEENVRIKTGHAGEAKLCEDVDVERGRRR